ncbi:hypothetical protein ScPMuIL_014659 [Solemya velum]
MEAKYQKLATEYAKLKAQIPVLKKGFLDEQAAHNELKDIVKEKEQSVRKLEQEVDSLTFRNQQLSKRVLILQEEFEATQQSSNKKKNKHNEHEVRMASVPSGIFSEELQGKIEENAKLHKQVYESGLEYETKMQELRHRLSKYEQESSQHQQVLSVTMQKNKSQIEKLQEEKAMLEVKLQTLESDVKNYRGRAEIAEEKLTFVQGNLEGQLDCANKIINDRLPFIDTKQRDLNSLNIPTYDRKHQLRTCELVGQAANLMSELVQALSNFYTYSEQRSRIYPADGVNDPLSPINNQYCKYLHENVGHLRPVEQSLKTFVETLNEDSLTTLETATDLHLFAKKFKTMVAYMNKLLPYQLKSIEEECAVGVICSLLGSQSSNFCCHPRSNHPRFFILLCRAMNDAHDAVKDVSKHYNSKVSLEHQLPTATQKLKTTDECIVSSLISLVTCTGKFAAFLSGNQEFFSQTAGYRTRGSSIGIETKDGSRSHPAVVHYRQKTYRYIASLVRPYSETVPHKLAVQNRKFLLSSAENKEGLSKQITSFQQRVSKLEQDKEYWMLELQLLQIKYDNELQKVKKLENELSSLKEGMSIDSIVKSTQQSAPDRNRAESSTSTGSNISIDPLLLGKLEAVSVETKDSDTREQLIKKHFTHRINEVTLQLQQADSKSVNFHSEVRALHKQLKLAIKSKTDAQEDVKDMSQKQVHLKDELQTTTKSYEGQLSMMSEHLAGMNEKLAQQKDEIDELKMQLSNSRGQKKSRK